MQHCEVVPRRNLLWSNFGHHHHCTFWLHVISESWCPVLSHFNHMPKANKGTFCLLTDRAVYCTTILLFRGSIHIIVQSAWGAPFQSNVCLLDILYWYLQGFFFLKSSTIKYKRKWGAQNPSSSKLLRIWLVTFMLCKPLKFLTNVNAVCHTIITDYGCV